MLLVLGHLLGELPSGDLGYAHTSHWRRLHVGARRWGGMGWSV